MDDGSTSFGSENSLPDDAASSSAPSSAATDTAHAAGEPHAAVEPQAEGMRAQIAGSAPAPESPEATETRAELLESYWQELRDGDGSAGENASAWLDSHGAGGEEVVGLMQVLDLLHEARRDDEASHRIRQLAEGEGSGISTPALAEGTLLSGKLRVLSQLDAGGMGEVYVAWHLTMECEVAVKVLPQRMASDQDAVAQFRKGIAAQAQLRGSEHIVATLDADQHGDRLYLVMEYVPGVNLATHVAKSGPLPWQEALRHVREAALGLRYAHALGVIHRDIKPSNLILTDEGKIKILDWGLARWGSADEQTQSRPRALGTFDYLSPEQARDPAAVVPQSDLYSLGATLYFLLAGSPPFAAHTTRQAKLQAHSAEQPPSVLQRRPALPAAIDTIIRRLMHKEVAHRPASAAELVTVLDRVLEGKPITRIPRRTVTWAIFGLLAALAMLYVWRSQSSPGGGGRIAPRHLASDVVLDQLELQIARGAGGNEYVQAIAGGRAQFLGPLPSLAMDDGLAFHGTLSKPANWYVVRRTLASQVAVEAFAAGQSTIAFPTGEPAILTSSTDSEGVQLLLIVIDVAQVGNARALTDCLDSLPDPPGVDLQVWTRSPDKERDPGDWRSTDVEVAVDPARGYLRRLELRLPREYRAVAAVFIPYER